MVLVRSRPRTRPCSNSNRSSATAITAGSCVANRNVTPSAGERPYPVQHSFARRVIELRGGFVRDDDAGACRDRLGERGALLLSPREFGGQVVDPIADVQKIEQPVRVEVVGPAGTAVPRDADALRP